MKKTMRFFSFLLLAAVLMSMAVPAYAAGKVTYDGYANEFIFEPGSEYSPTDLFSGFKNVMPGDVLTDQIVIRNDNTKKVKVKVYMRSLGAQEDTDEFLSQMKLTVNPVDEDNIFEAPADETAQLTDWVYLGTLKSSGYVTLDLLLEVPITMGNDFQNKIGYIDWEFKIEEIPIKTDTPSTGDNNDIFLYSGLMVVSLAALMILLFAGKRRKQDKSV